jgi:hypothetical protein
VASQLSNTRLRLEALSLAVAMYASQTDFTGEAVLHAAGEFLEFATARPVSLTVGRPVTASQANPGIRWPAHQTGDDMAVTMTDTQQCTYPAPSETDSKGYPVTGDTITVAESSGGTVVQMTQNADGTTTFVAVAPGSSQVSWTDGTLSYADTINVTAGAAATLSVGQPVIENQPAPAPALSTDAASAAATDPSASASPATPAS